MAEPSTTLSEQAHLKSRHEEKGISLLNLLLAIGRKKHIVGFTVVIAIVIGLLLAFLLPAKYTAETTLLPPQHQSSLSSLLSSQLGGLGAVASLAGNSLGLKNPNDMYVAMFRSQTVEDAMIRKYGLMREYHAKLLSAARKSFESHSSVNGSTKDGMLHITVTDHNPERAAEMANGYVKEFRGLSNHLAITSAAQREMFFQQQMETAKDKLTNSEVALEQTEEKGGIIGVGSQARALIQTGAALKAQVAAKEVEIQGMRSFAAQDNPNLIQAEQELSALQAQFAKLVGKSGNPGNELILPKGKLPAAGLEYLRRYRDVQYDQTMFDVLAKQFEVAKLDAAREGAFIQVVDPAIVPDHTSSPKRVLILACCLAAGFLLGIFLALTAAGLEILHEDTKAHAQLLALRDAFQIKTLMR